VNFGQALGKVVEMQEAGALPKTSIIVKSGRGMWLVYLLHDPNDTTRAPRAFPEKLALYFRLQKAIVERLAAVGADPCGKDATRYIRVPGSLHSGSEQHAQWWIQGEGPRAYSYSLSELCQLFGVEAPKRHIRERAAIDSETSEIKRRGWVALNARRLRDFTLLRSMRGGFEKGCRSYAALLYAHLLRTNRVPRSDAAVQVNTMGRECHPALTPSQCRDAVQERVHAEKVGADYRPDHSRLARDHPGRIGRTRKVPAGNAFQTSKHTAARAESVRTTEGFDHGAAWQDNPDHRGG
jgi:hypothetical protein